MKLPDDCRSNFWCSAECHDADPELGVHRTCPKCGKGFRGYGHTNVASDKHYCSRSCALVAYWTGDLIESLNNLQAKWRTEDEVALAAAVEGMTNLSTFDAFQEMKDLVREVDRKNAKLQQQLVGLIEEVRKVNEEIHHHAVGSETNVSEDDLCHWCNKLEDAIVNAGGEEP